MTASPNPTNEIPRRREAVAKLRAAHMTQREIVEALGKLDPPIITSVATVNRDLRELRKEWNANASRSTAEWLADEIHEIQEIKRMAWTKGKYQLILNAIERESKLLGLDKPTNNRNLNIDLSTLTNEQLERLAAGEDLIDVLTTSS